MLSTYHVPYRITRVIDAKRPLGLPEVGYLTYRTYSELDAIKLARERLAPYLFYIEPQKIVVY